MGPFSNSTLDLTNIFDPGVPGFIGPDGIGQVTEDNFVNPLFVGFATEVVDYSPAPGVAAEFSDPTLALGEVTAESVDIVSLGELTDEQVQPFAKLLGTVTAVGKPIAEALRIS